MTNDEKKAWDEEIDGIKAIISLRPDRYSQPQERLWLAADEELKELRNRDRLFWQYLQDTTNGMECLDTCDSYSHDELCPVCNPVEAFRKLRVELKRLREAVEWALTALVDLEEKTWWADAFYAELRHRAKEN